MPTRERLSPHCPPEMWPKFAALSLDAQERLQAAAPLGPPGRPGFCLHQRLPPGPHTGTLSTCPTCTSPLLRGCQSVFFPEPGAPLGDGALGALRGGQFLSGQHTSPHRTQDRDWE